MELLNNYSGHRFECGTDEAGRGCLAGPVTAAAVILPEDFTSDILNDSKMVTVKNRNLLRSIIEEHSIAIGFHHLWPETIDKINILNASIECMHLSICQLKQQPDFIIVDGNRFKTDYPIAFKTIIKGDSKYISIAAASIIAKTMRDEIMVHLHEEYPMYNWKKNKGYPTKEHRDAIIKYGITKYHRRSFKLLPEQLQLNF